jgi:hypothetical protein
MSVVVACLVALSVTAEEPEAPPQAEGEDDGRQAQVNARLQAGHAALDQGNGAEAEREFLAAARIAPTDHRIQLYLGEAAEAQDHRVDAAAYYRLYLPFAPEEDRPALAERISALEAPPPPSAREPVRPSPGQKASDELDQTHQEKPANREVHNGDPGSGISLLLSILGGLASCGGCGSLIDVIFGPHH